MVSNFLRRTGHGTKCGCPQGFQGCHGNIYTIPFWRTATRLRQTLLAGFLKCYVTKYKMYINLHHWSLDAICLFILAVHISFKMCIQSRVLFLYKWGTVCPAMTLRCVHFLELIFMFKYIWYNSNTFVILISVL